MREIVLLGAGASVEAGVPDAFDMTRKMLKLVAGDFDLRKYLRVIRFAAGGLLFQRGIQGNDPFEGVNIEELFNAVQLLAERQSLEAAPFIGSSHPLVESLDRISSARPDLRRIYDNIEKSILKSVAESGKEAISSSAERDIDSSIASTLKGQRPSRSVGHIVTDFVKHAFEGMRPRSSSSASDFEREMAKATGEKEQPGRGHIFRQTNQLMIQLLAQMVWIEDQGKVDYLTRLLSKASQPLVIATLNYDNAVELAAAACGMTVDTGIDTWSQSGQFPISDIGVSLLKLHGSIDWALTNGRPTADRPMPFHEIKKIDGDNIKKMDFVPAVIFGSRNKLTAAGPYLDLLRAFSMELMRSDRLTVIGYSFRDDHVNEYISQWINGDARRSLRIINGPAFDGNETEYARQLLGRLKERVEVVRSYASDGIQQCFGSDGNSAAPRSAPAQNSPS